MTGPAAVCAGLRSRVEGQVVLPGDRGYDGARQVWNAAVDRRPAAIVRPTDVADVQATVRFAAKHGLPVSVRGSGHHHAGHAAGDGAVMVDLSGWHRLNVDPSARTVTARPGVTWAELDQATARFGLATTGADVPAVGVAGTALGRVRLAAPAARAVLRHLVAGRLVTAAGQAETDDPGRHADWLWGLSGGGGALGAS